MLISIVIPVYNSDKYLRECIQSLLQQTYHNIEYIFVNDGSKDQSLAILQEYETLDSRVRVLTQANKGPSAARNNGMNIAKGEYVLFFDSDDLMEFNAIERFVTVVMEDAADLVMGNLKLIDENGNVTGQQIRFKTDMTYIGDAIMEECIFLQPAPGNKLYRLELLQRNQIQWENYRTGEDLAFYTKFLASASVVRGVADYIYSYRVAEGSLSHTYNLQILDVIKAFDDIVSYYQQKGILERYRTSINTIILKNSVYSLEQLRNYDKKEDRSQIKTQLIEVCKRNNISKHNVYGCKEQLRKLRNIRIFGRV